jgi:hypothetical protein
MDTPAPRAATRRRLPHFLAAASTALLIVLVPWSNVAAAAPPTLPCALPRSFHARDFDDSTHINNRFLPLRPGMQFTLVGEASAGHGQQPHTVILTVTDLVKVIDGVRTVVLWDRDFQDGQLTEAELAFHAQDNVGNVWGLGEYPEEYDNGRFSGAPNVWINGQANAQGGIAMLGRPRLGTPIYLQGVAPTIDFLDCARVFQRGQRVCVQAGCFDHVLVTDETSPLAGPAHQHKFYAPGVGNVKITAINDPEGETLNLRSVVRLDRHALEQARQSALALDRHAYTVSAVYRHTPPATTCDRRNMSDDDRERGRGPWCDSDRD